jgi:hypothetical protein
MAGRVPADIEPWSISANNASTIDGSCARMFVAAALAGQHDCDEWYLFRGKWRMRGPDAEGRLSQKLRPTVAWDERPSGRDERLFLTVLRLDLPFR